MICGVQNHSLYCFSGTKKEHFSALKPNNNYSPGRKDLFVSVTDNKKKIGTGTAIILSAGTAVLLFLRRKNTSPLGKNIKEAILDTVKTPTNIDGKDACVFNLKNYPNMVLRVKRSVLLSIDALSDNLTAVPIKYKDELLQKQDLGIPLYAIVDKKKISAKTKYILPSELSDYNEIMLLKKMEGVHPSDGYFDSLMKFAGAKNRVQQYNFQAFLNSVHSNNGVEFLESCKNGSALRVGLDDVQSFYKNYEDFAKKYLNTITKISELPQGVYDKARDTINASERLNYRFDFDHPLNTVIDFDKNKFSFVDIQLNPEEFKYFNYKYPLEVFRSALLGYGSINVVDDVSKLIVRPEDRKQYEIITKKISEKVFGKL